MTYKTIVQAQRLFLSLVTLVLVYIGNAAAGWPVDWWVPVWAVFTLDAVAMLAGFAWGAGSWRSSYVAAEEYGEYVGKKGDGRVNSD